MNTKKLTLPLLLFALIALGNGFEMQANGADQLRGRWRGNWASASTGHHGPLKARFRQQSDGSVRAIFSGRFAVVVPFRYTMKLQPTIGYDGDVYLNGSKRLPFSGRYNFSGVANGCALEATYSAGKDRGTFSLQRVGNR